MKLVKFLQKLNREQVTIELKNGTVIQGTVVGVDATMNCHLKKVTITVCVQIYSVRNNNLSNCRNFNFSDFCFISPFEYVFLYSRGKNPVSFPTLSVRGSTMRTWILPESLNLDALLIDDTTTKSKKAITANVAGPGGGGRSMGRGRGRGGGGGGRR